MESYIQLRIIRVTYKKKIKDNNNTAIVHRKWTEDTKNQCEESINPKIPEK